jgi:hypothetical protein
MTKKDQKNFHPERYGTELSVCSTYTGGTVMQMHSAVLFEVFNTGFIFLAPVLEQALQLL